MLRVHFKLARDGLGQRLHEEAADLHEDARLRHRCGGVEQGLLLTEQCSQGMRPSIVPRAAYGGRSPARRVARELRQKNSPHSHATLELYFRASGTKTLAHESKTKVADGEGYLEAHQQSCCVEAQISQRCCATSGVAHRHLAQSCSSRTAPAERRQPACSSDSDGRTTSRNRHQPRRQDNSNNSRRALTLHAGDGRTPARQYVPPRNGAAKRYGSVCWAPDASLVACGAADGSVTVWDVEKA